MELTIEQSCPSCGAAIVLSEDDKLIRCGFCDVSNFRLDSGAARYTLPHKLPEDIHEDQLIYVPYLRFKGVVYFVEKESVKYKFVDTTKIAIEVQSLPSSLGLRPQTMKVRAVTTATKGQFMRQTIQVKAAFLRAAKLVDLFSGGKSKSVLHRAFIGETISVIYQPFYIKDDNLVDAVDGRSKGTSALVPLTTTQFTNSKKSWEPIFIGTLCLKCGGPLTGERDSRVLSCENCQTRWLEGKAGLKSINWSVVEGRGQVDKFFPFWKISFSTSGVNLQDFDGLLKFTNQHVFVKKTADQTSEQLFFLLPAFKVNPKMYLQISSQLTMAQGKLPKGGEGQTLSSHPVNLNQSEAIQAIKSVLAHLTIGKKKKLHLLPKIGVDVHNVELLYVPFTQKVHDYIQCHTPASIQVAAVRYGRSL